MPQQDNEASELHEAEVVFSDAFVASGDPAEAQKPGEEAFDLPASLVSTQRSTVLLASALVASRRADQLDVFFGERDFELRAVVGFVADELLRLGLGEAFGDGVVDETYFAAFT
jgi:hypothetical protein